jgi:uncharacterized protein YabE (DUF348 family)
LRVEDSYFFNPHFLMRKKRAIFTKGITRILLLALLVAGCQTAVTGAEKDQGGANIVRADTERTAVPTNPLPTPQPITIHIGNNIRLLWTQQPTLGAFLAEVGVVLGAEDEVYADKSLIPHDDLHQWPLPEVVEIGRYLMITIKEEDEQRVVRTSGETVGEALSESGLTLFAADIITPSPETLVNSGMVIQIQRSIPLLIQVDGRVIQTRSAHTNPGEVVAEAGITLLENDHTQPGPDAVLHPNDTIVVIRVTEDFRLEDESIPYQTLWQASPDLDLDTQAVISPGSAGILRRRYRIQYENGAEVGQVPDGEWVEAEPVNEVIGYGTRINVGVVETDQGPREYWRVVRMRVTSYTAASSGKAPEHPRYGITASGLPAGKGVVAIDRNIVPWKSELFVPGYGVAVAGDTGGGIRGRWIDLGFNEDNYESWTGHVDVYYLTPVPAPDDINYILPSAIP